MVNGLRVRDPQPVILPDSKLVSCVAQCEKKEMTHTKRCFDSSHHSVKFLPFGIIASHLLPHQLS